MQPVQPHPPLAPADAERAYTPSSCIGGAWQPHLQAYIDQSAQARADTTALGACWLRLACGGPGAALPALDLCLPPGASPATPVPVRVFIHGGYWQELSAEQSLYAATACVRQGMAFAALDYSLAPAATVGGIVAECTQALAQLHAQGPALGLDPQRCVLAGHSAGAHLAVMATRALPPAQRAAALMLVSGVYWLQPLRATTLNHALGLDEAQAAAQSPGLLPLAGLPPAWVCWGEVETAAFKAQGRTFAAALQAAGVPQRCFEVPQRNHFNVVLQLCQPDTGPGAWLRAGPDFGIA
jgi:arylformamidase